MSIRYRLGLDVGSKSLGWWIWEEDENGEVIRSVDGGVRIYSDSRDPKSHSSLAVERRVARGMRRRRDRYLKRRSRLMDQLIKTGLMPVDSKVRKSLEHLNPHRLRVIALDTPLKPFELGRALFHLNQRRGFKSNRIAEAGVEEKERGVVKSGISTLDKNLREHKCRTIGEFLYKKNVAKKSLRFRPGVSVYPSREHYQTEFELIRKAQEPVQKLSTEDWDKLYETIFHQRNLRPVKPGRCTLFPDELRAPLALPISQEARILQEVNNLQLIQIGEMNRDLTPEERLLANQYLLSQKRVTFDSLRKKLGVRLDAKFNLESDKRKALDGDQTAAILRKQNYFGKNWDKYRRDDQTKVIRLLLESKDDADVSKALIEQWNIPSEISETIATVRLPQKYSPLSEKALNGIVPFLCDGYRYDEAVNLAFPGIDHFNVDEHRKVDQLPYYPELLQRHVSQGTAKDTDDVFKRLGRISNPTVHVGLNQIRRVVNEIITTYGPPRRIMVELARELKLSSEQKQELNKRQAQDTKNNLRRRKDLENCGREPNPRDLRRVRLWEEQGPPQARCCPYCGSIISYEMVLDGRTEVDHILPFSRTLDDSLANKVICCIGCNRMKGNKSPEEAFGSHETGDFAYENILIRVSSNWPENKKWRFNRNAMDRYEDAESGFLDRQLNDTRYLSRITKTYLQFVCDSPTLVSVNPGKLTALIRGKWGLNDILADSNFKNRDDHRHHAIDAAVIALIDRSILQRVATAAAKGRDVNRFLPDIPKPRKCRDFREQIREHALNRLIVVHRPRHTFGSTISGKTSGQLHNETAFGIVDGPDKNGKFTVVRKVVLNELNENEGQKLLEGTAKRKTVMDDNLRVKLLRCWQTAVGRGETWKQFCEYIRLPNVVVKHGVRAIRCWERKDGLIAIHDQRGNVYKGYKPAGNARIDIFQLSSGRFRGQAISNFAANQKAFVPQWRKENPGAKLVLQLFMNDLIAVGEGSYREIFRIVKLSGSRIWAAPVNEVGDLRARDGDSSDPFKYFDKAAGLLVHEGLRRLKVNELGHIFDPGPIAHRM